MFKKMLDKIRMSGKVNKNSVLIGVAILAIIITGALIFIQPSLTSGNMFSFLKFNIGGSSAQTISKKALDYLNKSILEPQGKVATLEGFSEESGVVKIKIKIDETSYDSYVSRDGKLLFPEAFNMDAAPVTN